MKYDDVAVQFWSADKEPSYVLRAAILIHNDEMVIDIPEQSEGPFLIRGKWLDRGNLIACVDEIDDLESVDIVA